MFIVSQGRPEPPRRHGSRGPGSTPTGCRSTPCRTARASRLDAGGWRCPAWHLRPLPRPSRRWTTESHGSSACVACEPSGGSGRGPLRGASHRGHQGRQTIRFALSPTTLIRHHRHEAGQDYRAHHAANGSQERHHRLRLRRFWRTPSIRVPPRGSGSSGVRRAQSIAPTRRRAVMDGTLVLDTGFRPGPGSRSETQHIRAQV
jgi:hypothetical protein